MDYGRAEVAFLTHAKANAHFLGLRSTLQTHNRSFFANPEGEFNQLQIGRSSFWQTPYLLLKKHVPALLVLSFM